VNPTQPASWSVILALSRVWMLVFLVEALYINTLALKTECEFDSILKPEANTNASQHLLLWEWRDSRK
jgi:hypothetical protein